MREVTCSTIRDLLPLYVDGAVGEDTRALAAEHLEGCAACQGVYEGMRDAAAASAESGIPPLGRTWRRKRLLLAGSAALAAIAVLCGAFLLFSRLAWQEKIAVDGAVYAQRGENIPALPAGSREAGCLRSITHRTGSEPSGDLTGVNLDEKYAGCMICRSKDGGTVYLEDYGGFYIPFVLSGYAAQPEDVPQPD